MSATPQQIAEQCLELSRADGTVVVVQERSEVNLRWADNSLTTNGMATERTVTVVATVGGADGTAAGVVSRSATERDELADLVRAAEAAAQSAGPAEDAGPLVVGDAAPDWDDTPGETAPGVFSVLAPALGDQLAKAEAEGRALYGYTEHKVVTTYLASSTGLRRRHEQPAGSLAMTGKATRGPAAGASSFVARASRELSDVDPQVLGSELSRRLGWAARQVELPPGRYDTVLPPDAVAELVSYVHWLMGARDMQEGRSPYAMPGRGVGDRLSRHPITLWSDPAAPGFECAAFLVATGGDNGRTSVFDNGLPLERTEWIRDGRLEALAQTRHTARLTGMPLTPDIGNVGLTVAGGSGTTDGLVAGVERGLLLTSLWYIGFADPAEIRLTGLTRDGVYVVEDGEVVGASNNFRFNESVLSLLDRFTAAGASAPAWSRELGEWFPRMSMPSLRVPDFTLSSVSRAS